MVAVGDALEHFPADEIVLVGTARSTPSLLVVAALVRPPRETERRRGSARAAPGAARGRSSAASPRAGARATPFVAFVAANLGLLAPRPAGLR